MADKQWKKVERVKCTALGGKRTGPRGFGLPDCVGIEVALEIKHYKRFTFLTKDWEQAVENAARVGKPPVLAVKEGGRNGRDCVQLQLGFFVELASATNSRGAWCSEHGDVVRITWSTFVQLYHAYYNKEKCPLG